MFSSPLISRSCHTASEEHVCIARRKEEAAISIYYVIEIQRHNITNANGVAATIHSPARTRRTPSHHDKIDVPQTITGRNIRSRQARRKVRRRQRCRWRQTPSTVLPPPDAERHAATESLSFFSRHYASGAAAACRALQNDRCARGALSQDMQAPPERFELTAAARRCAFVHFFSYRYIYRRCGDSLTAAVMAPLSGGARYLASHGAARVTPPDR